MLNNLSLKIISIYYVSISYFEQDQKSLVKANGYLFLLKTCNFELYEFEIELSASFACASNYWG